LHVAEVTSWLTEQPSHMCAGHPQQVTTATVRMRSPD
jgi:hypothetical protein